MEEDYDYDYDYEYESRHKKIDLYRNENNNETYSDNDFLYTLFVIVAFLVIVYCSLFV